MVKKKRGSSLITVVIISGILITVGAAMLSMTLGDYKMRMNESTRIKNLYSSESGLDVANNILIKTFDAGAIYGAKKVELYKKTDAFIVDVASTLKLQVKALEDEKKAIRSDETVTDKNKKIRVCNDKIDKLNEQIKIEEDKAIDKYFKMQFNEFVYMNEKKDDESTIILSDNYDELRKSIMGKKYIIDSEKSEHTGRYKTVNLDTTIDIFVDTKDQDNKGIYYDELPIDIENGRQYPTRKYEIKINSNYITEDTNGKTERKLQSTYYMTVPDYKDIAFSESNVKLAKYTSMDDKALIIGGNMNIEDANLTVNGNVFVEGDGELTNEQSTRAYDKYNGGIVLDAISDKTVKFNGDVITGKTFNIRNYIDANIDGNLYAMNVYAGSEKQADPISKKSTLNVNTIKDASGNDVAGEVVVDNDITLKADYTSLTMEKFYGINDKNIKYDETKDINASDEPLGRTSSSIIVNGNKDSSIIVKEQAYIMGVAHINTKNGYSTGESTAVKGNYIAYAVPSEDEDGDINEEFEYDEPLQLLKEDNVIKKSEHFVKYWTGKLKEENTGGIQLPQGRISVNGVEMPRTCSIGAIVYKGLDNQFNVVRSSYSLTGFPIIVKNKQNEFASKVYNIGGEILTDSQEQVLYQSLGRGKDKVSDLIDIDDTLQTYKELNKIFFKDYNTEAEETADQENNNEKAIFSDKNIKIIESSDHDISIVKDDEDEENGIIIKVPNGTTLNAFIATSGDIMIEGKVDFKGNIIATGDLEIKNTSSEETNIQYNKDLLDRIQASNVELFNSVFGHMRDDSDEETTGTSDNINVDYDVNKFVKNKLWKIIK